MLTATTRVPSVHARRYLRMLCKHFAHKVPVEYSDSRGDCQLPPGPAILLADEKTLDVQVSAETLIELVRAKYIVTDHLLRFSHREVLDEPVWKNGEKLSLE